MREIEKDAMNIFLYASQNSEILVKYDKDEDVLYINFLNSAPQEADFGTKLGDYIVRLKRNKIVGVTILNAMEHFQIHFSDMPDILYRPIVLA